MNRNAKTGIFLIMTLLAVVLSGCAGVQTFPNTVRAGDTAALAAGWKSNFARDNITVTITDAGNNLTVYPIGSPAVRAVVNLYPDPLSGMVVADRTGIDLVPYASNYAMAVNFRHTNFDRDWWQTLVFVDLPASMTPGIATVRISNSAGASTTSTVQVLGSGGQPAVFNADDFGPLQSAQLAVLERVPHYEISFSGSGSPHALELQFSHSPGVDQGGTGRAHVVNPRGDIKNLMWTDDGTNLHVILTPAGLAAPGRLVDYKFYVTGGIVNLQLVDLKAFSSTGALLSGFTATTQLKH